MATTATLEQVLVWIGRMSWQASVLVVLVLVAQRLFQTRLAPRWRYALWWLVLLRLILPMAPETPFSIFNVVQGRAQAPRPALIPEVPSPAARLSGPSHPEALPAESPGLLPDATPVIADPPATTISSDASPSSTPTAPESAWPLVLWGLAGAWAVGVGLLLGRVLWGNLSFAQRLRRRRPLADPDVLGLLDECRRVVGVSLPRAVIETPEVDGPALFGCFRVKLLLPPGLAGTFSRAELRHVFLHELAHLRRWDVPTNWLMTLLQIAHWFNPVIWLASSRMRTDRELACDALALSLIRDDERRPYGQTIIKFLEGFVHPAAVPGLVGILEEKAQMKRRIHMIARFKETSRWPILAVALFLGLGLVTLTDARNAAPLEKPSTGGTAAADEARENPAPDVPKPTTSAMAEGDVIVDPNTGVKFVLAKTFSGANNVIGHVNKLIMSPDARFLLFWGRVIPLDGTETFSYTEQGSDVRDVAVSPNGRYIAHGQNAVWLQPVSPETLRPDGPAKKLLDLREGRLALGWGGQQAIYWTRDSQTVFFHAYDAEGRFHQYAFSAATGAPVSYPDAAATGLPAPDGKCVALTLTDSRGGFWVKPMGDSAARMLCEQGPNPMCWSQDGQWLIGARRRFGGRRWEGAGFVRYPEGQEYLIPWPMELETNSVLCVGPSADRSKLFFYQGSTKLTYGVRVASAEGTALSEVDVAPDYRLKGFQWAPDGRTVFHQAWTELGEDSRQWETGLFASSFSGDKPVPFTLQPTVSAKATLLSVSPDSKWLLFTPARESGSSTVDLNVIPLSMADHKTNGPATVVLRIAPPASGNSLTSVWSPDSTRVALTGKADPADDEDIWVVFTDGRTPIRLTRTAAIERDLTWSPDGKMLAFVSDDAGVGELKVVPSAGGDAVVIRKHTPKWGWSPDSTSLTLAEEGVLVRQPLSGGKAEPIANLKELGIESLEWHGWSPDGSRLAMAYWKRPAEAPLSSWGQLLFARVEGGRLLQTGAVDMGPATSAWNHAWSPDGTHVAYECEGLAAVRPEGRLYAVAVDDIVERIEAGAIPPTRPKAAEPAVTEEPSEAKPTPQLEPIIGPVFSDNFDKGLSKYWQIVPLNREASVPSAHAVENGQLMLVNSNACLNQIDWANYLVTVRVCVREGGPGPGAMAILARATPSNFGIKDMDGYFFVAYTAPMSSLRFGFNYSNASGVRYGAALGTSPCTLLQGEWYKLAFEVRGEHLRGYLDDKLVIEAMDARLSKGPVSISATSSPVLFDDFSVRRLP